MPYAEYHRKEKEHERSLRKKAIRYLPKIVDSEIKITKKRKSNLPERQRQRIAEIKYYYTHREERVRQAKERRIAREKSNPGEMAIIRRKYYYRNWDKLKENRQKNRVTTNEKEKIRKKIKRLNDKNFATKERLKSCFKCALKRYADGKKHTSKKYGIEWYKIIEYLKPFPQDILNYQIDHIIPLHTFDLTNKEEIKKAFSPENHQWLTIGEHLKKSINERRSLLCKT